MKSTIKKMLANGEKINKSELARTFNTTVYFINKTIAEINTEVVVKEDEIEEVISLDFNTFESNNTVEAPEDAKYLSEFMDELPKDCLFDKGAVGCGGTTLAIKSKDSYVIAAPFVSMIDNKCASNPEIFGVKEGVNVDDIISYMRTTDTLKIMVTYDSLYKVVEALGPKCKEVRLLVDELHILFTAYSYRKEAIKRVLRDYNKFKSYCFMTATPLDDEFMLSQLKNVTKKAIKWPGREKTIAKAIKCNDTFSAVCDIINSQRCSQNLYFFVNSVEFINKVVKTVGLNDENARMICSKSQDKTKLKISDTTSEPKKYNFITSTAFEGSDIFDENGLVIVVSDKTKAHTLLDIQTSIPQIAGRIRNTKYNHQIFHLYSQTRYTDVTTEEFKEASDKEIELGHGIIRDLTEYTSRAKEWETPYLIKDENGKWYFEENLVKLDYWNFKNRTSTYSFVSNLEAEYNKAGFDFNVYERTYNSFKAVIESREMSFIDIVKKLRDAEDAEKEHGIDPNYFYTENLKMIAFKRYEFLPEAIKTLGFSKIATLKYSQVDIKKALIVASDNSDNTKVIKLCKMLGFCAGAFVTLKEVKAAFAKAYSECGIKKTAKATDIEEFFDVKKTQRRIEGKQTEGYSIIRSRIMF